MHLLKYNNNNNNCLLITYKGCMTVVLAVRILISKFRFFKFSRMAGDSTNEKLAPERPLMHFLIIIIIILLLLLLLLLQ
jgi:hypothetical protein